MATLDHARTGASIAPATAIGTVRLTVSDIDASRAFYERALGLRAAEQPDGTLALFAARDDGAGTGPEGRPPLLELRGEPTAQALNRRATGLFHFAVLVPTRRDLALAVLRLARSRWPLDGASDHLVSEACTERP